MSEEREKQEEYIGGGQLAPGPSSNVNLSVTCTGHLLIRLAQIYRVPSESGIPHCVEQRKSQPHGAETLVGEAVVCRRAPCIVSPRLRLECEGGSQGRPFPGPGSLVLQPNTGCNNETKPASDRPVTL